MKKVGDHPPDHDYGADIADYSAVRVLVLIDNERCIKPPLVVRNLGGGLAGITKVRVVKVWTHPDGAPLPFDNDFSDWGDEDGHDTDQPPRTTPGSFDPLGQHLFSPVGVMLTVAPPRARRHHGTLDPAALSGLYCSRLSLCGALLLAPCLCLLMLSRWQVFLSW